MSCGESVLLIKRESLTLRVTKMKSGLFFTPGKTCLKQMMAANVTMGKTMLMMTSEGNECMTQCTASCRKLIKNVILI